MEMNKITLDNELEEVGFTFKYESINYLNEYEDDYYNNDEDEEYNEPIPNLFIAVPNSRMFHTNKWYYLELYHMIYPDVKKRPYIVIIDRHIKTHNRCSSIYKHIDDCISITRFETIDNYGNRHRNEDKDEIELNEFYRDIPLIFVSLSYQRRFHSICNKVYVHHFIKSLYTLADVISKNYDYNILIDRITSGDKFRPNDYTYLKSLNFKRKRSFIINKLEQLCKSEERYNQFCKLIKYRESIKTKNELKLLL